MTTGVNNRQTIRKIKFYLFNLPAKVQLLCEKKYENIGKLS